MAHGVMGIFLLFFTAIVGVLLLRLFYLPAQMVPQEEKAKYAVVATLCLLPMFYPGNFVWIVVLLVAMMDIPDYTPLLHRWLTPFGASLNHRKRKKKLLHARRSQDNREQR